MPKHSAQSGTALHQPRGVSPTPLELADNQLEAYLMREGSGANDYLAVTTLDGSEVMKFGNTSTNPDFLFLGSGTTTFSGPIITAGVVRPILTESTTSAQDVEITDYQLYADPSAAGGDVTFNLPTPASSTGSEWRMKIIATSANSVILDRSNGGNIEGVTANFTISGADLNAVVITCDGTDFWIQ